MKTYTAGSLIRHYRAAKSWEPDQPFVKIDWATTLTASEWLAWFRWRLDEKASRGQERTGRKLAWDWQRDCQALARSLAGRIIVRRSNYPLVIRDLHGRVDHLLETS
jgi:hypothetical protein